MSIQKVILFILQLSVFFVNGQSKKMVIPLHSVQDNGRYTTMTYILNKEDFNYDSLIIYKGIPTNIKSYIIKTLDFQPEQGFYELYIRLKGNMPVESLEEGLKQFRLTIKDTLKLSRIPVKHYISFLVGRNTDDKIVVIGDANNNYNFSDDRQFVFNPAMINKISANIEDFSGINIFHYEYTYHGRIMHDSIYLRMIVKNSNIKYTQPIEQEFYLVVRLQEYKVGILKNNGVLSAVKVVRTEFPSVIYNALNTRVFFNRDEWNQYYEVGDSIKLENEKYEIQDISRSGDSLFLSVLEKKTIIHGIYPGEYAKNINSKDILTNSLFNLNSIKNKYVLLDFWGSWCEPCIKSIPELVKFFQMYKKKLQIVSIAEEYKSNKEPLYNLIKEHGMRWIHLLEKIKDTAKSTIANVYRVSSYPTQILINPKGKIVFRSTDKLKLTENSIDKLLKK